MTIELPIPLSRADCYLATAAGMTGVTLPEKPLSREELYLAKIAGVEGITTPVPASLKEQWLAIIAGDTSVTTPEIKGAFLIGQQMVRAEFLANCAGVDGVVLPTDPNRTEQYFIGIAQHGPSGVLKTARGINIVLTDVVSGIRSLNYIYGDSTQIATTGKNIMPILDGTMSYNGLTITVKDGVLTIDGTTTSGIYIKLSNGFEFVSGGTLNEDWLDETITNDLSNKVLSIKFLSGTAPGSGAAFRIFGDTSSYIKQSYPNVTSDFTFPDAGRASCFAIYVNNGRTFNNAKYEIQLETGSTATSFEPYTNGIPAPNPSQAELVKVVTGVQTVTVSDGGSNIQTYTIELGTTELCKIDGYQDKIYKSGGNWYLHKEIGKYTFNGEETFSYNASNKGFTIQPSYVAEYLVGVSSAPLKGLSTHFKVNSTTSTWTSDNTIGLSSAGTFWCKATSFAASQQDCVTWLTNNTPTVYYGFETATDTKITDATLISQLNALDSAVLPKPNATIEVTPTGTNLAGELEISYYGESE